MNECKACGTVMPYYSILHINLGVTNPYTEKITYGLCKDCFL